MRRRRRREQGIRWERGIRPAEIQWKSYHQAVRIPLGDGELVSLIQDRMADARQGLDCTLSHVRIPPYGERFCIRCGKWRVRLREIQEGECVPLTGVTHG